MRLNLKIKMINKIYRFPYFHVAYWYFRFDSIILKRIVSFSCLKLGSRSNLSFLDLLVKAVNANEKIDLETGPQNDAYSRNDNINSSNSRSRLKNFSSHIWHHLILYLDEYSEIKSR